MNYYGKLRYQAIMADNVTPYLSRASSAERMRITGSRPAVFWMTGLSGSGKSTVAALAEKMLLESGHAALMIDGDTVRTGLCRGRSPPGRGCGMCRGRQENAVIDGLLSGAYVRTVFLI